MNRERIGMLLVREEEMEEIIVGVEAKAKLHKKRKTGAPGKVILSSKVVYYKEFLRSFKDFYDWIFFKYKIIYDQI